jgi:transcriptional antiterminator RfaH
MEGTMSYWACAQLLANQERLALHLLGLAGFTVYFPRIKVQRQLPNRKRLELTPGLFPGYAFVAIELQWWKAQRTPGVLRLVLDGEHPAHVPDNVIEAIRKCEVNGFVQLPKPRGEFERGDKVRVIHGALSGHLAVFEGMKPRERVEVLLTLLGSQRTIELPRTSIRRIEQTKSPAG